MTKNYNVNIKKILFRSGNLHMKFTRWQLNFWTLIESAFQLWGSRITFDWHSGIGMANNLISSILFLCRPNRGKVSKGVERLH